MKTSGYALTLALLLATLTACGSGSSSSNWPTSSQLVATAYVQTVTFRNHTAMAWGNNGYGQLGNGNSGNSLTPVPVAGIRVGGVSTGGTHSLAFKNLSGVWAWGNNGYGQVGSGTTTATNQPVKVFSNKTSMHTHLTNVTAVAAGGNHSLALDTAGKVWAWGANSWGQLGYSPDPATTGYNSYAMTVQAPPQGGFIAKQIAAGGVFSLALDDNGSVWAWGNSYGGQLGDGLPTNTINQMTQIPAQVVGQGGTGSILQQVKAIAAGGSHSLALLADGTVVSWGYNNYGQLGNDTVVSSSLPVPVAGLSGVVAIAAGLDHSLALKSNGTLWAWGYNAYGQLGNGTTTDSHVPVLVPVQWSSALDRILAIGHHSLAFSGVKGWSWGHNASGQLGINSTTDVYTPTAVFGFP
jgi:alpha-tubulin suppressor-like RCC1 family protein